MDNVPVFFDLLKLQKFNLFVHFGLQSL